MDLSLNNIKLLFTIIFVILVSSSLNLYGINYKEQAVQAFKQEHYEDAINYLKKGLETNKNDAETYYLLGYFTHYQAYDSKPLSGYDESYSKQIFEYFEKALELNPNYGDAKYFYGAECSANALIYMQRYKADSLKLVYKKAFDIGAYPKWLLEFGRNLLNSCEKDAILFAGGNSDFDVCMYLQLHENYRNDITLIPIGFIDRPYYINFLKNGLEGAVRPININLSDEQILRIHPYKFNNTTISINISDNLKKENGLDDDYSMEIKIQPDLVSNLKNQNNPNAKRKFLSPMKANLLQIIESNINHRPIFFSAAADTNFTTDFNPFIQKWGIVSKLLPFAVYDKQYDHNISEYEKFVFNPDNFKYFPDVLVNDIPRISSVLQLYYQTFLVLAIKYNWSGKFEGVKKVETVFENTLNIGFNPQMEGIYSEYLKRLKD